MRRRGMQMWYPTWSDASGSHSVFFSHVSFHCSKCDEVKCKKKKEKLFTAMSFSIFTFVQGVWCKCSLFFCNCLFLPQALMGNEDTKKHVLEYGKSDKVCVLLDSWCIRTHFIHTIHADLHKHTHIHTQVHTHTHTHTRTHTHTHTCVRLQGQTGRWVEIHIIKSDSAKTARQARVLMKQCLI